MAKIAEQQNRGRKRTDKYSISKMVAAVEAYTAESKYPILKELCLERDWDYDYVCRIQGEHEDLSKSIKKLHAKREVIIEKGAISGNFPPTFAIFRLKQPVHGWTDKQQGEVTIKDEREKDPLTQSIEEFAKNGVKQETG